MSVLNDVDLDRIARAGAIDPYDPAMLQPASIDCRLGTTFRVIEAHRFGRISLADVPLDMTREVMRSEGEEFWLSPGDRVLARTAEIIRVPRDMVARLEGKSSLGRLFLVVHATAGFFDPGFEGYGTLEFINFFPNPIGLVPGDPICQFSFHKLTGPASPYAGRYTDGNDAVSSRYGHEEFVKGPRT
jgi:dCTP deaminase